MNLTETPLSQEYKYKGRIINLRVDEARLPNGAKATREVIEHPGGVCVAALTDEGELLFVRQFRYPYQEVIPEIPAGKLTPGEDPLEWRQAGAAGGDRRRRRAVRVPGQAVPLSRLLRGDYLHVHGHRPDLRRDEPRRGRVPGGGADSSGEGGRPWCWTAPSPTRKPRRRCLRCISRPKADGWTTVYDKWAGCWDKMNIRRD